MFCILSILYFRLEFLNFYTTFYIAISHISIRMRDKLSARFINFAGPQEVVPEMCVAYVPHAKRWGMVPLRTPILQRSPWLWTPPSPILLRCIAHNETLTRLSGPYLKVLPLSYCIAELYLILIHCWTIPHFDSCWTIPWLKTLLNYTLSLNIADFNPS